MSISSVTSLTAAAANFTPPAKQTGGPIPAHHGGHHHHAETGDVASTQTTAQSTSVTGQTSPLSTTGLDSLI